MDCAVIITNAVNENIFENWVEYAFITRFSHIRGMSFSGSNVKPFTFMNNQHFVPYYGLISDS